MPLSSLLASVVSWRWVFIALGLIIALLAVLIARRLGPEARVRERIPLVAAMRQSVGLWRQRAFAPLLMANFFAQGNQIRNFGLST